jgi:imidazolonepropionase-like amidohydrolase
MGHIMTVSNTFRFIAATLCLILSLPAMAQDRPFALTHANLFDGSRNKIIKDVTVFVRDGLIERIITGEVNISGDYEVIDTEGNYLMPGMFDVHTHIDSVNRARQAVESGVTTVRSASVTSFQDVALRELVREGKIIGPEFFAAGIYITPNLGDTILSDPRLVALSDGVNTDDELRLLVNVNVDRGVDVIKTRGTQRAGLPDTDPRQQVYTERQLRVVVEEASKHGLPVLVHAHGDEGARAAVLAGARSIEHGTYLSNETLRLMKARGTWFVPTYVTMDAMNEERYGYVLRLRGKHMVPQLERAIREAYRIGVKIATGADHYYEEDAINRISIEVQRFVEYGMSHFDALKTATVNSAELLQIADRTGRIKEGFEADMILIPGNPLTNIEALQDVLLVMRNGRLVLKRILFSVSG